MNRDAEKLLAMLEQDDPWGADDPHRPKMEETLYDPWDRTRLPKRQPKWHETVKPTELCCAIVGIIVLINISVGIIFGSPMSLMAGASTFNVLFFWGCLSNFNLIKKNDK